MRKYIILHILIFVGMAHSYGQVSCGMIAMPEYWYFDGGFTPFDYILQIDTLSNPGNLWQVGSPQKMHINNAYSALNAIVTDTLHPYPPNNVSVFIFKHIDQGGYSTPHSAELAGYYYVNSDSLHDYGTVEISLDQGASWINLITDTVYTSYYDWHTEKPTLTGNSNGWQNFFVSLARLGDVFPVNWGDTILLKFTFVSDAVPDTLDGLAFDNFQFCDGVEGIEELPAARLIVLYPNPTQDVLFINRRNTAATETLQIFSYTGQLMFVDQNFTGNSISARKLNLSQGLYFLKYSNSRQYSVRKFMVE